MRFLRASFSQRLVAREARVLLGEDLQRRRRGDLVRLDPLVLRVAPPQLVLEVRLHPHRRAAARQVGADEQRGRRALGHGDEAALLGGGVDRPGREHDGGGDPHHPPAQQRGLERALLEEHDRPAEPGDQERHGHQVGPRQDRQPEQRPRGRVSERAGPSLDRQRQRDERRQQQERAQRLGQLVAGGPDQRRIGPDDQARRAGRPTARRGSTPARSRARSSRS